jgi:hypothetical protein
VGIIEAEKEINMVFPGQLEKHFQKVIGGDEATHFLVEDLRGIRHPVLPSATDHDNRIDPDGLHGLKIAIPLLIPPVLMGDVVADLVQKRACYFHSLWV